MEYLELEYLELEFDESGYKWVINTNVFSEWYFQAWFIDGNENQAGHLRGNLYMRAPIKLHHFDPTEIDYSVLILFTGNTAILKSDQSRLGHRDAVLSVARFKMTKSCYEPKTFSIL